MKEAQLDLQKTEKRVESRHAHAHALGSEGKDYHLNPI